jgi:tetratricopeptide (TPR) repeat protein
MTMTMKSAVIGFALVMTITFLPHASFAFRNVQVGAKLPNARLWSLTGTRSSVLSSKAKINVFIFFRPKQEHSQTALKILTEVCKAFKERSVRCVAIVSDYHDKNIAKEAVRGTGLTNSSTFIDKEDRYYGKLGVSMHPTIGVADGSFTLLAYEPFATTNYFQRIEARIKYALGDIDKKQLRNAVNPPVMENVDEKSKAQLNFNYAKRLFEMGKLDRAIEQAKHALSKDDQLADAYGLIGLIYATQKKCDKAKPELEKALSLDKNNRTAIKGKQLCK